MNYKRLAISEAAGVPAAYFIATGLHFAFDLSGGGTLAIIFGAVNESVWEHVKIFTAGYCIWALAQLLWVKVPFRRYVVGKCCGLYLIMGGMIGFYYLYTSITGTHILLVDLISSAVILSAAHYVSYRLTVGSERAGEFFVPALMLLMLYYLMFFSFTVIPPRTGLFRDPQSGGFGIQ